MSFNSSFFNLKMQEGERERLLWLHWFMDKLCLVFFLVMLNLLNEFVLVMLSLLGTLIYGHFF